MRTRSCRCRSIVTILCVTTALFVVLAGESARAACWYLDNQWPTTGSPVSIAVDTAGHVYVTCHDASHGIQKYSTSGKLVAQWGARGSGRGQLLSPHGVAVDRRGTVYVADTGNRRIEKFRSDGTFLGQWQTYASGRVRTFRPFGVAVEASGQYVYVTDEANNRVLKFMNNGFPVREWGGYGSAEGRFMAPRHITTDSQGLVYVVDSSANCVKRFDHLGAFQHAWGGINGGGSYFNSPMGVAVDYSGYVWVTDGTHRVQQFRQVARREGWFGGCDNPQHAPGGCWHNFESPDHPAGGSGAGQLMTPRGLAVDLAGNLYVADFANRRIQKLASLDTSGPTTAGSLGVGRGLVRY